MKHHIGTVEKYWERILAEDQWGFRPQRITMDRISIVRQIQETFYAHDIDIQRLSFIKKIYNKFSL